ncbi:MAG: phosphopentomutase [Legionellaceae bacterium]|nr:phosphopentomutase [Legionellaceae bacterium]
MTGRVCILLLDSLGIGASVDAVSYGDEGADTLGHIVDACQQGQASEGRSGPLHIPHLIQLGLYHAATASSASARYNLSEHPLPIGLYGYAVEKSPGKDTPSGHWELAGVPLETDWGYFPNTERCFPKELIEAFIEEVALPGVLGEKHASGTDIIRDLGEEHIRSGKPIVYTSGDSVFQIAAHETYFGLTRLYEICEIARRLVDPYSIGRVIARPFIGEPGAFQRTANRRDYAIPPPKPTLLDALFAAGREVIGIGKIGDIFAHRGLSQCIKADGNMALFDATLQAFKTLPAGGIVFTNFVDFDSSYGHRRDVAGYARALEAFDARLPEFLALMQPDDVVLLSADHGCDPTAPGSDHTREHVPVLMYSPKICSQQLEPVSFFIGRRDTFADMGQSLATVLEIPALDAGVSFIPL